MIVTEARAGSWEMAERAAPRLPGQPHGWLPWGGVGTLVVALDGATRSHALIAW